MVTGRVIMSTTTIAVACSWTEGLRMTMGEAAAPIIISISVAAIHRRAETIMTTNHHIDIIINQHRSSKTTEATSLAVTKQAVLDAPIKITISRM